MAWGTATADLTIIRNTDIDITITLSDADTGVGLLLADYDEAVLSVRDINDAEVLKLAKTDGQITLDNLGQIIIHFKADDTKSVIPYETNHKDLRWDICLTETVGTLLTTERPYRGNFKVLTDCARVV